MTRTDSGMPPSRLRPLARRRGRPYLTAADLDLIVPPAFGLLCCAVPVPLWTRERSDEVTAMFGRLHVLEPLRPQRPDEFTVGSAPGSAVHLQHESVDARHALLRWRPSDAACWVRDLGSTHGTFVNGTEVWNREARLRDTDIVSIGDVQLIALLSPAFRRHLLAAIGSRKSTWGPTPTIPLGHRQTAVAHF